MKKLSVVSLFVAAICVAENICKEGTKVRLARGIRMVCSQNAWVPAVKRSLPGAPPCEDSVAEDQCSADKGNCNQYTEKGSEMNRRCPGTCGSCDGCRCQDSHQWHNYCSFWKNYCASPGALGTWMGENCRKTCNSCKCNCCSYKGKKHSLGETILMPDKCGELVCGEGLRADDSPLLPGAYVHNVTHPEELTLSFRSLFPGSECCLLPADEGDGNNGGEMVQEGWTGTVNIKGKLVEATCCHANICIPLEETFTSNTGLRPATTTTNTTTTTTTKTTTTTTSTATATPSCPNGWSLYESSCYIFYTTRFSWTQAQAECQKMNANLASVHNEGTNTFIQGQTKGTDAWIGGSRPAGSDPKVGWNWLNNSAWKYENWESGEPNRADQLCLHQYAHGKWDDDWCINTLPYVCDKPLAE